METFKRPNEMTVGDRVIVANVGDIYVMGRHYSLGTVVRETKTQLVVKIDIDSSDPEARFLKRSGHQTPALGYCNPFIEYYTESAWARIQELAEWEKIYTEAKEWIDKFSGRDQLRRLSSEQLRDVTRVLSGIYADVEEKQEAYQRELDEKYGQLTTLTLVEERI